MTDTPQMTPDKSDLEILQSHHCPLAEIAPFILRPASKSGALIISAPHGGTYYPTDLPSGLPRDLPSDLEGNPYHLDEERLRRLRSLEDVGTSLIADALYSPTRPVLSAQLARGIIDLNRPAEALDPLLYDTPFNNLPASDHYAPYIAAGYGVMPRLSAQREPLYAPQYLPLSLSQSLVLIDHYHRPYHEAISSLLAQCPGQGMLIDIHSMPDRPQGKALPDFIFGDDFGTTLPHHIRPLIDSFMQTTGHSFGWNHPYAGGYITRHYGNAKSTAGTLQIEVNRRLYTGANMRISRKAIAAIATTLQSLISQIETAQTAPLAAQ